MSVERLVRCKKYGVELPGLDKAPFSGAIGQEIYDSISARAWNEWRNDMMIKVINEYRLNMADPADYQRLLTQMRAYLNLDTSSTVLEVENETRGRG